MFAESRQVVVIKSSDQLVSKVWLLVISDMFLDILGLAVVFLKAFRCFDTVVWVTSWDMQTCKHTLDLCPWFSPWQTHWPTQTPFFTVNMAFLCFLPGQDNFL